MTVHNVGVETTHASSDSTDLLVETVGPVAVLTINRADKFNSLPTSFWPDLRQALETLAEDRRTRAVVLTGAGRKAFSAGGDIEGFSKMTELVERREFMVECMRAFSAIEESPLPVIAAVNGWALGGGCELAMACDIVLAAESARFGVPEAAIGLVPGFGVLRGPTVIGRHWMKHLVFTGEKITADEAHRLGLVQRVVPDDQLRSAAIALGERIAAQAPLAVTVGKRLINRGVDRGEFGYAAEAITMLQSTDDASEGFHAFVERRPATFHGR